MSLEGADIDPETLPENAGLLAKVDAQIAAGKARVERQRAMAARIADAVAIAAGGIQKRVADREGQHAREEDLRGGIADALRARGELVLTEARVAVPGWSRNLGGFDLAIVVENALVVAETKWADGNLEECLWDLFKLGSALEVPRIEAAVVIYGAPVKHWQRSSGVARLFESRDVLGRDLIQALPQEWARNLAGSTVQVGSIPLLMKLELLSSTPISVLQRDWEIRAVAVASEAGLYHLQDGWPHGVVPSEPAAYEW